MKSLKITLIFSFLLSTLSFGQTADEIVASHIKATGGAEAWNKVKSIKMDGSIEVAPNMKAPFTLLIKDRKKIRFELDFQGMKMIQAFDGDSGWAVVPFSGKTDPERMSEEQVRDMKDQADIAGDLFDFKAKGNEVEYLGKEEMEGTDTYKLKLTKKNGDVKYYYLDASSYLVLKETSKHKFQDKEVESVTLPSDYRSVSGIMVPFSMETRGDEEAAMGQTMVFEKIEVNPAIENTLFVMPAPEQK